MKSATDKAKELGWGCVVQTTMTVHDVPFSKNPEEVIPTEKELDDMRQGFDAWLKRQ